jgi:O-antigen/teichoic acid export membrane protein
VLKLLIRGSALQLIAFAIELATAFLLMPFLIHSLGVQGYGSWAIISTIVGGMWVMDFGLAYTTQRFIAHALGRKDFTEVGSIYTTSIILFSLLGLAAMLLILSMLPFAPLWYAEAGHEREFQYALAIAGLNVSLRLPFAVLGSSLLAKLRSDAVVASRILEILVRLGLIYASVEHGYGIVGVAASNLTASLLGRISLGVAKRKIAPEIKFSLAFASSRRAHELVRFGKYVFVIRVSEMFRYRFDNLIIAPFLGLAAVTHYSVAVRLSDYLDSLISRVVSLAGPVFVMHAGRGETAFVREKFLLVSEIGAGILGIATGGVLIFGKRFIEIWLGSGFTDSFYVLTVMIAGVFFNLLQTPSRDLLGAIYKHPFDAKWNTIETAMNIALTIALIPPFGIMGAAFGTTIPTLVTKGVLLPRYACGQIGIPIGRYLAVVGRPLAVASMVNIVIYASFPLDQIHSLAVLIGAGSVFGVIASFAVFLSFSYRCKQILGRCKEILGDSVRGLVWDRGGK